jgi:septal ring factor EnvC (AmiA/AmiB activator)
VKTIIESIERKVSKLLIEQKKIKNKNSNLQINNNALAKKLDEKDLEITKLLDKVKLMNISKSVLTTNDDVKATRLKINEYVREIDKCIALLNK